MSALAGLLVVAVLAYAASSGVRALRRKGSARSVLLADALGAAGIGFLVAGVLLGPEIFGLLSVDFLEAASPVQDVLVGWVGWLLGTQFPWRKAHRLPRRQWLAAVADLLGAGLVVAGTLLLVTRAVSAPLAMGELFLLALTASVSSPLVLGLAMGRFQIAGAFRSLAVLVSLSPLFGIWLLHLVPAFVLGGSWWHVPAGVGAGLLLGACFLMVTARGVRGGDALVVAIGFVALGSGLGRVLGTTPLPVNLWAGVVVSLGARRRRAFSAFQSVERPFYLILLVFLGAHLRIPATLTSLAILLALGVGRVLGKLVSALFVGRLLPPLDVRTAWPVLAGHGGLAAALALALKPALAQPCATALFGYVAFWLLAAPFLARGVRPHLERREAGADNAAQKELAST